MTGPDVERFVLAQDEGEMFSQSLAELHAGRKRSHWMWFHWMWFVFPQVEGLGRSPVARNYAVSGLEEARAYLAHPVLGPRLRQCCEAVLDDAVRPGRTRRASLRRGAGQVLRRPPDAATGELLAF